MASSSPPTASPPLPMLVIPEKKPVSADLYNAFRSYICTYFSEREAQLHDDDIRTVQTLRSDLARPFPASERRDLLLRYSRAISAALPRFPSIPIPLSWQDAFRPSKKATSKSLSLDRAAALFSLASSYSESAVAEDRRSEDGRKAACSQFQAAAGALVFLKKYGCPEVAGSLTVDLTQECVGMLEKLMLAQAQECFFEKVIADGKAPAICSKVARQVSLYYEEVDSALSSPQLSQHLDKVWMYHVQLKMALFHAEACYRAGLDLYERDQIGEQIARLKDGVKKLVKVKKSFKGAPAPLLDAVSKLEVLMNSNLAKAVKENEQIYILRVPEPESLNALPGVSLVKPMVMDELLDGSKEKLFAGLVPEASAKALSRYTEMVDEIIRTQAEKLQQESEITRVKLKEMDLPDSIIALEGGLPLPVDLRRDVEAVQVAGGLRALETSLRELCDLKTANQELLIQIEEMLENEEREDNQFRAHFGSKCTRPPSKTLTTDLQERLSKFASALKQAADSDMSIQKDLENSSELLGVLDFKPIESAVPSLARPIMSLDGKEDAVVGSLKLILRQLENLSSERASLEDMLKEMKRKDDILPKLMAISGSQEDLFRKEISKYDPICDDIVQNIQAQEKLLLEIQVLNDEFSSIFNVQDYKVLRERSYKRIAAAVAKFGDIKGNINEGLKFYGTLREGITNVKEQCNNFIMTRSKEFQDAIQEVEAKIASMDISDDKGAGYGYTSSGLPNPSGPSHPGPLSGQPYQPYIQATPSHQSSGQPSPYRDQPYQSYVQAPPPPQPNPPEERQQYNPTAPSLQPNPRDQPYYHPTPTQQPITQDGSPPHQPYQQTQPPQQPNPREGQSYFMAPPHQQFNPHVGQHQPYHPVPPPQQPIHHGGQYQPYQPMPPPQVRGSWSSPPHQPYPRPTSYHQPPIEQRYSSPSYSSYASQPVQPSYSPPSSYSYQQLPPTRAQYQPPYPEYGPPQWGTPNYNSPQYRGAPPPYSPYGGLEQYAPHHGYRSPHQ